MFKCRKKVLTLVLSLCLKDPGWLSVPFQPRLHASAYLISILLYLILIIFVKCDKVKWNFPHHEIILFWIFFLLAFGTEKVFSLSVFAPLSSDLTAMRGNLLNSFYKFLVISIFVELGVYQILFFPDTKSRLQRPGGFQ